MILEELRLWSYVFSSLSVSSTTLSLSVGLGLLFLTIDFQAPR